MYAMVPIKFPVPALAKQLEQEWAPQLAARFEVDLTEFLARPTRLMNFPAQTVTVELMDGSSANFRWAFPLVDAPRRAIAVFTEHCGHHIYPSHEARVLVDGVLVYGDLAQAPD